MTLIHAKNPSQAICLSYDESTLSSRLVFLSCNLVKSTIPSETMIDTANPSPPDPFRIIKEILILAIGAIILVGAFALHGRISFYLLP
jgi:hypothetical protein